MDDLDIDALPQLTKDHLVAQLNRLSDYQETFKGERGERVLTHLCSIYGVTNPRFTINPNEALFFEGQRHVILSILKFLGRTEVDIMRQISKNQSRINDHE
jgi:hypothetical protein